MGPYDLHLSRPHLTVFDAAAHAIFEVLAWLFHTLQQLPSRLCRPAGLKLMWSYIFLVSMYDIWLVIAVEDVIFDSEQNPICLALIRFDSTYYSLFISSKVAGTLFAISVCDRLVANWRSVGVGVTSGLAGFQSVLLLYLSM